MKVLFVLFFSAVAVSVAAQQVELNLEQTTGINKLRLKSTQVGIPKLLEPGSTGITPQLYYLQQDNMPCVVPDTTSLAVLPNALPEFNMPNVAAIPNPVYKNNLHKTTIVPAPDSK